MSRAAQIKAEIAELQSELDGLAPMDAMGVRELAREAGISPATASRIKNGETPDLATAQKLLPFMNECPCCGKEVERNS